jgi:hypothetical protein
VKSYRNRPKATELANAAPTPYPEVNAVLEMLLKEAQAVLGDQFVGLYVHGSLASGGFDPQRSDIDFVAVTAGELPDETLTALAEMHARISASGLEWARKLEGPCIPRHGLRRYDPARARYPWLGEDGHLSVEQLGSDWVIQLHVLREHGIAVAGPDPQTLIDPIQPDDLRRAQQATLHEWWQPQLDDPSRLRSRRYQAYSVLTMCRALYMLEHGTVVTKAVAAQWAQETLGQCWAMLIERALAWPRGPQPDQMNETLDLIRHTLQRSEQVVVPADEKG